MYYYINITQYSKALPLSTTVAMPSLVYSSLNLRQRLAKLCEV